MEFALWSVIVGLLLVLMALGSTVLKRLPLSTAMLYLLVGIAVARRLRLALGGGGSAVGDRRRPRRRVAARHGHRPAGAVPAPAAQGGRGAGRFVALGLIALAYGCAVLLHAYGFLAVFAAGVALRQLEQRDGARKGEADSAPAVQHALVHPDRSVAAAVSVDAQHAPAYMTQAVLGFNQQAERIGEVTIVITIGALLWALQWDAAAWWFVPLLLLLIRPLSVQLGLARSRVSRPQRWLMAWFGIRGVGSLYYLMFAVNHGLAPELADRLVALTLSVVVTSIAVHGVSVTPLMSAYEKALRSLPPRA